MEHFFTWTKGIFDTGYQIFTGGQIKCTLLFETWKTEAKTIGLQQDYHFKTKGIFETSTTIFNQANELVGTINFNIWKAEARIAMKSGVQYNFGFTNSWLSTWSIADFAGKRINYHSNTTSGTVISNTHDELMLVTGFFVHEYYARLLILIIILVIVVTTGSSF